MESQPPTINELFPHLNPTELQEAVVNIDRYLTLVLQIFERIQSET
jgi:hypothetical protein